MKNRENAGLTSITKFTHYKELYEVYLGERDGIKQIIVYVSTPLGGGELFYFKLNTALCHLPIKFKKNLVAGITKKNFQIYAEMLGIETFTSDLWGTPTEEDIEKAIKKLKTFINKEY